MTKLPTQKLDVQLIALDLDDTLLNDNAEISDKNVEILQKCAESGIYVVLCSGRLEAGIAPFVRRLQIAGKETGRYVIAINGCSVFDMHERKQILCHKVPSEILIRADELAREAGLQSQIYSTDTIYYSTLTDWIQMDIDLCKVNGSKSENYYSLLQKGSPKMLVPCNPETPEDVQKLQAKMKAEFGNRAEIFTSKPYFLEILPANCGKGQSVLWLAEHIGLDPKKTMAFGDGMNDESMILQCGYGVAMKNACEHIKTVAKFVTEKTNDESGVGDFIEKFVLF